MKKRIALKETTSSATNRTQNPFFAIVINRRSAKVSPWHHEPSQPGKLDLSNEITRETIFLTLVKSPRHLFLRKNNEEFLFPNETVEHSLTLSTLFNESVNSPLDYVQVLLSPEDHLFSQFSELIDFVSQASKKLELMLNLAVTMPSLSKAFHEKIEYYAKESNFLALSKLVQTMNQNSFTSLRFDLNQLKLPVVFNPSTLPISYMNPEDPLRQSTKMVLATQKELIEFSHWLQGFAPDVWSVVVFVARLKSFKYALTCTQDPTPNPHENTIHFIQKNLQLSLDVSREFTPLPYQKYKQKVASCPISHLKTVIQTFTMNLVSLNLSGIYLGDKGIKKISPLLTQLRALKELDLSHNFIIKEKGALALSKAFFSLTTLHKLVLTNNFYNARLFIQIMPGLIEMTQLTTLSLNQILIGRYDKKRDPIGVKILQKVFTNALSNLTDLSFQHNDFTSSSIELLLPAFLTQTNLTSLDLSFNNLFDVQENTLKQQLSHVSSIKIAPNQMT